jgi:hypothetical protein
MFNLDADLNLILHHNGVNCAAWPEWRWKQRSTPGQLPLRGTIQQSCKARFAAVDSGVSSAMPLRAQYGATANGLAATGS